MLRGVFLYNLQDVIDISTPVLWFAFYGTGRDGFFFKPLQKEILRIGPPRMYVSNVSDYECCILIFLSALSPFNTEKFPPPPVENVQSTTTETSLEVTWVLPQTTTANEIYSIAVSFGKDGALVGDITVSYLDPSTDRFSQARLEPGTSYVVAVTTENQQGQSEPVIFTVETMALPDPTTEPATTTMTRSPPPGTPNRRTLSKGPIKSYPVNKSAIYSIKHSRYFH